MGGRTGGGFSREVEVQICALHGQTGDWSPPADRSLMRRPRRAIRARKGGRDARGDPRVRHSSSLAGSRARFAAAGEGSKLKGRRAPCILGAKRGPSSRQWTDNAPCVNVTTISLGESDPPLAAVKTLGGDSVGRTAAYTSTKGRPEDLRVAPAIHSAVALALGVDAFLAPPHRTRDRDVAPQSPTRCSSPVFPQASVPAVIGASGAAGPEGTCSRGHMTVRRRGPRGVCAQRL